MSPEHHAGTSQRWDPGLYDRKHAFVWQFGDSLIDLLAPRPGERILDLGCGTGHLTARLAEAGADVVGLDHSAEMLDQARQDHPQLQFVQADARDFSFTEPFDAIFSNAALHWIKEPEAVIRCVRTALRPGGRFVCELGGRGNVRTITDALAGAAERMGIRLNLPLWFLPSLGQYAALLESAGLTVTSAMLFDRPTPLEGEQGLRDWVQMFARSVLDLVPAQQEGDFLRTVEELTRPALLQAGVWIADYRRLRIVAVREE